MAVLTTPTERVSYRIVLDAESVELEPAMLGWAAESAKSSVQSVGPVGPVRERIFYVTYEEVR